MDTREYWLSYFKSTILGALSDPDSYIDDMSAYWEDGLGALSAYNRESVFQGFLSYVAFQCIHDEFSEADLDDCKSGRPLPIDHILRAFEFESDTYAEWKTAQGQDDREERYKYDDFWCYLQEGVTQSALADEIAEALSEDAFRDVGKLREFYDWAAPHVKEIFEDSDEEERSKYFDPFGNLLTAPIPDWAAEKALNRDGSKCAKCQREVANPSSSVGYLLTPRRWGLNDLGNLAVLCEKCT